MNKSKLRELSRIVSHALRHEPQQYGLQLDLQGWVSVDALLLSVRTLGPTWEALDEADLHEMMQSFEKKRHEIVGDQIRALYGHSANVAEMTEASEPPERLYHGTAPTTAEVILHEGLKPMTRQYVHLSTEKSTAMQVGQRKAPDAIVLVVRAQEAHRHGVPFFRVNDVLWLARDVPSRFVERQ